jgi:hypothetical protein
MELIQLSTEHVSKTNLLYVDRNESSEYNCILPEIKYFTYVFRCISA